MKKDALFLCQFSYPEYVSSALLPYQTAVHLAKEGYKVDILCGYPKEYTLIEKKVAKNEEVLGVNIYRKRYLQVGRINKISRLINYFSFTLVIFLNMFKLRKYKTVFVYSNPPIVPIVAILANKLFKTKIIFIAYDLYPEIAEELGVLKKDSAISKLMLKINFYLYKQSSRVVALSEDMKNYIVNNREIEKNQVEVIPNWATENELSEPVSLEKFNSLREKYTLIVSYFGNMGTAQDFSTIQEVINDSSLDKEKICFLFAGHGNKKQELQNFIAKNNLVNSYVFDYLSGTEFNDAMTITDLCIVSLEKKLAGLAVPSKTYSYYQAKKPVIGIMSKKTDIYKEIRENKCGLSVENGESQKVVSWLINLISNPDKINTMKKNVEGLYHKNYLKEYQMMKYTKLLETVLEGK